MYARKKQSVPRKETAELPSSASTTHTSSIPSQPSSSSTAFPASSSAVSMPVPHRKADRHHTSHHGVGSPSNAATSVGSEKSAAGGWFPRKGWFGGGGASSSTRERVASGGALDGSSSTARPGGRTISHPSPAPFPTSQSVQVGLGSSDGPFPPSSPSLPRPAFTQHPSTSSTSIASANFSPPTRGWFRRPATLSSPTPPPPHLLASHLEPVPPVPPLLQTVPSSASTSHSATLPVVSPTLGLPIGARRPSATSSRSISPSAGVLAARSATDEGASNASGPVEGNGLSGLGKKSWSRSMDDLSRLLIGGGEKAKAATTTTKARIDDYRRQRNASQEEADETINSPVSPASTTSPRLAKLRAVAYGIDDELSSQEGHSAPEDPLSPFSDHADLPPTDQPSTSSSNGLHPSSVSPSASFQSSRTARPPASAGLGSLPVSGSTPAISSAQHSPSMQSLSSWANGVASTSTKATAGVTKRALHAGGGLAGKVMAKPVEMFGHSKSHSRTMSGNLLGSKSKEKDKNTHVRSARERLMPLDAASLGGSSPAGTKPPLVDSGPATAPSASSSFPRHSLYPASASSSSTPPSTTLAASPTNRSSQMVLQSGLVLRHTPAGPSSGPFRSSAAVPDDLSKGWKPFKMVLQGSKLHFYKPPSDKKVEIESRFPTRVVQTLQVPSVPRRQRTDESVQTVGSSGGGTGRRARSFWGVGRHPELDLFPLSDEDPPPTLTRDKIRSATPEALVHELVFASQMPPREGRVEDLRLVDAVMFASMDFTTPLRFVAELKRAVERATSASLDDDDKHVLVGQVRVRVHGIVERFCTGFGGSWWTRPADETTKVKEAFREVIALAFEDGDARRLGLIELVNQAGDTEGVSPPTNWTHEAQQRSRGAARRRPELHELAWTGLSLETFLSLDPIEFARSIHIFHSDLFSSLFVGSSSARCFSPSLFVDATTFFPYEAAPPPALASFSFSPDRPHFLTRLVLDHIFVATQASSSASATPSTSHAPSRQNSIVEPVKPTSATSLRAKVLQKWIVIGEHLRLSGDSAGFMAVAMAVCSRPVARLTQTWKRISDYEQTKVRIEWVGLLSSSLYQDQEGRHIKALLLTPEDAHKQEREGIPPVPYLGTVVEDIRRARRSDHPSLLATELGPGMLPLLPIWEAWEPVQLALGVTNSFPSSKKAVSPEGVVWELEAFLQTLASSPTPKACETHAFHKASIACEPRLLGHVEEAHARLGSTSSFHPNTVMIPLLFPQALPTISLIDRDSLLQTTRETHMGARTNSSANLAAVSKGGPPPVSTNGHAQASLVGLNAGGGRKPVRPRSLSGAHARTESLDLALPSAATGVAAGPALPSVSEASAGRKLFFGSLQAVGGLGETVISQCGGNLVLKVNQDPFQRTTGKGSRPTSIIEASSHSRRSSIIGGASARDSLTLTSLSSSFKRNSNPVGSRRDSIVQGSAASKRVSVAGSVNSDGPGPLRVDVKAGSLDNLLDVLLFGVDGLKMTVKDDMGVESGSSRRLHVNLPAYRTEFFATFRSFTTPSLIFEHMRQRYHSCVSAVEKVDSPSPAPVDAFPTWPLAEATSPTDWRLVGSLRLAVLSTLEHWLTQGLQQDMLDEPSLLASVTSFLEDILSADLVQGDARTKRKIQDGIAKFQKALSESLLRPPIQKASAADASLERPSHPAPSSSSPPTAVAVTTQIEQTPPLSLVNDLDSLASFVLSRITEEDLLCTAELFEMQCAEPTGWLPMPRPSTQTEEDAVISDFHYALTTSVADPSSRKPVSVAKRLPMNVRYAISTQSAMRSWLIGQIADPSISPRRRQARLEALISALDICRSRSADPDTTWTPSATSMTSASSHVEPRIATFVGSAIRAALLSPESRTFGHSWYAVALVRDMSSVDGLAGVLSDDRATAPSDCTVDLGWFLERLIEVVCMVPDSVDSASSLPALVNFDKRRYIFKLIGNASGLISSRPDPGRDELGRLAAMQRETTPTHELRSLRDFANREQHSLWETNPHHRQSPKGFRPFGPLVAAQMDKQRRDKIVREKLGKLDRRANINSLDGKLSSTSAIPPVKKKTGRSFLRGFRPLSMGHSHSSHSHAPSPEMVHTNSFDSTRTLEDVDFITPAKPTMVVSIVDSKLATVANCPRSFVFQLTSDEGAKYILQAPSASAVESWMSTLQKASRTYSEKRRTVLEGTTLDVLKEAYEPQVASRSANKHPSSVYGVDLREILRRESASYDSVPRVVERLLIEIERRGLDEQGIYRIPGTSSAITALQHSLDRDASFRLDDVDVHVLCGAFKLWIRSLPEPVIPYASYGAFVQAGSVAEYNERLYRIKDLVWNLPSERFVLLKRICEHLDKVTTCEEENRMNANSLAVVFGPNLLKPYPSAGDYATLMRFLGPATTVIRNLVSTYHWVFFDVETAEAEVEAEEEVVEGKTTSSSILEETEGEGDTLVEAEGGVGGGQAEEVKPTDGISSVVP